MKLIILVFTGIVFSSCMHLGMMGHGDHANASNTAAAEPVLVKEATFDDIKAIATFAPLQMEEDVMLRLELIDTRTSQPISGAKVFFHAVYMHTAEVSASHNHGSDTQRPKGNHEINIDQEVHESSEAGVYTIPYGSSQPGEHRLMFHIAAIGGRKFEPEFVVEAKRMLKPESHEQSGGMMGMGGATPYVVAGAVVMGAMMVLMLSRGTF